MMASSASASPVVFLLLRSPPRCRRGPPLSGAFFCAARPSSRRPPLPSFQRGVFAAILESVLDESPAFSCAASLCFRELYVVLFRAELLAAHVASAGRALALICGPRIAASFRDLDAELAVVLDMLPAASLRLGPDARDNLDLRSHCRGRRPSQYRDPSEAALRDRLLSVLRHFELSDHPDPSSLQFLLTHIGISDCRAEIEYLEVQIMSQKEDTDLRHWRCWRCRLR